MGISTISMAMFHSMFTRPGTLNHFNPHETFKHLGDPIFSLKPQALELLKGEKDLALESLAPPYLSRRSSVTCGAVRFGGYHGNYHCQKYHHYHHYHNISEYIWLVVWNMAFIFPYIGNFIIPTDYIIFFTGVGIPPTRYI